MIYSALFVILAAICNAVMDRVGDDTAYSRSIFSRLNPKWWSKVVSWEYVKFLPLTKYRPDAWHLAKSFMVIFLVLAVVTYTTWQPVVDFLALGFLWNATFNLFYNHIFYKK